MLNCGITLLLFSDIITTMKDQTSEELSAQVIEAKRDKSIPADMKCCNRCNEVKKHEDFPRIKRASGFRPMAYCKACVNKFNRDHHVHTERSPINEETRGRQSKAQLKSKQEYWQNVRNRIRAEQLKSYKRWWRKASEKVRYDYL